MLELEDSSSTEEEEHWSTPGAELALGALSSDQNKIRREIMQKKLVRKGQVCWETCPSGWKIQRTGRSQNQYRSVLTDWEGHICKYAEKSYMYKYDLGHILSLMLMNVVVV